jgi:ABC-type microcin C transport system permease subunit YejE
MSIMDDVLDKSIWGSSPVGYSFQASTGASGGLLTVWDCNHVDVWSTTSFHHVLIIACRVIQSGQEFVIVNVYAPCDTMAKQVLWNQLLNFVIC